MKRASVLVLSLGLFAGCAGDDDGAYMGSSDGAWYPPGADAGVAYDSSPMADGSAAAPVDPEDYGKWVENDWIETATEPLSTFGIDVDTASYSLTRQSLNQGVLPDPQSVRVEEHINYFKYDYPQPTEGPFSINMEGAPSKFGQGYDLLRIGLQGLEVPADQRKPANLVFLIDVSGSMSDANKLPLVKGALSYLVEQLMPTDTLGIVAYGTTVTELLQPTTVTNKAAILTAIGELAAGGATAGGPGIQKAYAMAKGAFITGGINRVILCTDGDFNVGLSGSALVTLVEEQRDEGVTLSVLGFGMGNYQDTFLEDLSNKGNGNYAYIDSQKEAEKVFGEKLLGTLQVIAKDVKVQIEFNKLTVKKYRLVGYENRLLMPDDFEDDSKDGGEIGSGHRVTAFYEMEVIGTPVPNDILATVRFRYKEPDGTVSKELTRVIRFEELGASFEQASPDFRFAAAVVELAEILRHSKHSQGALFDQVWSIAAATAGNDPDRLELVGLVDKAKALWPGQ